MADMGQASNAVFHTLSVIGRSVTVAALVAIAPTGISAEAAEPVTVAMAGFDFVDTSGETRDQTAEHDRRLQALDRTILDSLAVEKNLRTVPLDCVDKCTVGSAGVEALSRQAVEAGASHLLIGQVRKMSTLVGGVKFAVIDLDTNRPTCDRFLSYRGDTDEAWSRAAAYAAQDVAKHCLPGP
ncbi:DUF2380 domain-containing protein [Pseudorhizobium flavum]|jgi:hypothetical protein|uniref:DUF2380 domain-containing protein n=1 Tax=Pseudorhizobium flavum TaxID=1335061 RepID=A0A7W9YU84_9HYPH|nr:DUF2380 domain-containing protein [Pseudorhizobium flavum]MBB6178365.1 hypothetical protein [Pseudorhizobium flavum]